MNPVRPWYYAYVLLNEKTGKFYTGASFASNGIKGGLTG